MNDPLAAFPAAISSLIYILIVFVLIALISFVYKWQKRIRSAPTPPTPTSTPGTPATAPGTPVATPPAQSGWRKYKGLMVPAIAVIVFAGVAWLLFSAGYLDTGYKAATGWIPASAPVKEQLTSGCSGDVLTETGYYYNIQFDENWFSGFGGCDPFREGQNFSLEVIKGTTKYWSGQPSRMSAEVDANGSIGQSAYKQPTAENFPAGMILVSVSHTPSYLALGKQKLYFKVNKTNLEVYDKKNNGSLIRKFPIVLPSTPGGWSSQLKLVGNSRCEEKNSDGSKICTAAFTVRQEYYTK